MVKTLLKNMFSFIEGADTETIEGEGVVNNFAALCLYTKGASAAAAYLVVSEGNRVFKVGATGALTESAVDASTLRALVDVATGEQAWFIVEKAEGDDVSVTHGNNGNGALPAILGIGYNIRYNDFAGGKALMTSA